MHLRVRLIFGFGCLFGCVSSVQPSLVENDKPRLARPNLVELLPEPVKGRDAGYGPLILNISGEVVDLLGHPCAYANDPNDDDDILLGPPDGPPPGFYRISIALDSADPNAMKHLLELKRRSEKKQKHGVIYYRYLPNY